jgi:hypothetical protein
MTTLIATVRIVLVGDGREGPDTADYLKTVLAADIDEMRGQLEESFQCFDIAGLDVKLEKLS